jgi:hypothetical protein
LVRRRSQLVRGVRDEVAPHHLLPFQALRPSVERIGEADELLGAFARDASRVVALRNPTGRGSDLLDRSGEHPREDDREHHARDGRDNHRRDDDGRHGLVVHRLRVLRGVAGLDHQVAEDLATDDRDPDRHDRHADRRRREGGQRDARRDPAPDHRCSPITAPPPDSRSRAP